MQPPHGNIKFRYNAALSTSHTQINSDHMHYLYQKDERALPGNLQNRWSNFSPLLCYVCRYHPTSFVFSLSLQDSNGY
jgi:hypothetical protein